VSFNGDQRIKLAGQADGSIINESLKYSDNWANYCLPVCKTWSV